MAVRVERAQPKFTLQFDELKKFGSSNGSSRERREKMDRCDIVGFSVALFASLSVIALFAGNAIVILF